jgi:hypothetical protein
MKLRLKIAMKNLKSFKIFESSNSGNDRDSILEKIKKSAKVTENPSTGLLDVEGDVDLSQMGLKDLDGLKFGVVTGNFNIRKNMLETLKGCPTEVSGFFDCSLNRLTSLKGCPEKVGSFYCKMNGLENLEYGPKYVTMPDGNYVCDGNPLKSFEFIPVEIGKDGVFSCGQDFRFLGFEWNLAGILGDIVRLISLLDIHPPTARSKTFQICVSYLKRSLKEDPEKTIKKIIDLANENDGGNRELIDWAYKNLDLTQEEAKLFRAYRIMI